MGYILANNSSMDVTDSSHSALDRNIADDVKIEFKGKTQGIDTLLQGNDFEMLLSFTMGDKDMLASTLICTEGTCNDVSHGSMYLSELGQHQCYEAIEEFIVNETGHRKPSPSDVVEAPGYAEFKERDSIRAQSVLVVSDQSPNRCHWTADEAMKQESNPHLCKPGSSLCSESKRCDGLSILDHKELLNEYFDELGTLTMENAVILGSKIATNPPGITSEYRMFKRDMLKKRQTVRKDTLEQLVYPAFINYLHSKRKCTDARTIEDLNFFQKEKAGPLYHRSLVCP